MTKAAILLVAVLAGCGGGGTGMVNHFTGTYRGLFYGGQDPSVDVESSGVVTASGDVSASFTRPQNGVAYTLTGHIDSAGMLTGQLTSAVSSDTVHGSIEEYGYGTKWTVVFSKGDYYMLMVKQ